MEAYQIITAGAVKENLSWDRVVDIICISHDGDVWEAHHGLEDSGEYEFLTSNGDHCILKRM